ncbi:MAG: helix-turn-helix domain-containing protein [Acidobacteriota bacterium]|nr:helix-turn-helix domain-containing protein [Acidobacteriota bacterium]
MEFREIGGPPQSAVERIWFARGAEGIGETILPDGRFELIFNFGDLVVQNGESQPRSMLSAETRRAVTIEPSGRVDFVGVTLRDGHAAKTLGIPLRLIRDRMLDLRDVRPRLDLHDRLAEVAGDEARAELVMRHLGAAECDALAERAAMLIRRTSGRLSISHLARSCGVTIRTLSRTFDRAFGLTPKTLARVARLGHAASLLRSGESVAEAAGRAGFCDQSHMTNEFRMMARLSPTRWNEGPDALAVQFLQDAPPLPS